MTSTTEAETDEETNGAGETIVGLFRQRVRELRSRTALRSRSGDDWSKLSWSDYGRAVEETAAGLIGLEVAAGDRVGLLSANEPNWHVADLAVLSAGATTVPVYPTSTSSQVAYVLRDSRSVVCFVQDALQLAKVLLHRDELPDLRWVVLMSSADGLDHDGVVVGLDDLRRIGAKALDDDAELVARRAADVTTGSLATLVYTSGTTGPPKGARITHGNITWTIAAMQELVDLRRSDRFLSYLPLSHIAERVTSHFGQIVAGGETWFAQSLVTVPEDLRACRPTIFFAVPRVWQKFRDAILEQIEGQPLPVRALFEQYVEAGQRSVAARQEGRSPSLADQGRHVPPSVVDRLRDTGMPMQIILVDDGSSDGTGKAMDDLTGDDLVVMKHEKNRGKGAAIRTGITAATGDVIVIQDADREYDPTDFRYLLQPILAGEADVAYGTRYGHCDRQLSPWWHQSVNGFISLLASVMIGIRLSDVETCYKMTRTEHWQSINDSLKEDRFGIEIEVTARWVRAGLRFTERPIRYQHRWYDEGKKIGWKDGVRALWCIAKYGLFRR